ncbi:MAG TPA: DUF1648 domain-containing protein [Gemmatimonadaceae bacterium]|nr:DUF1648 domain-containing protein [Gemmatimonadaceae bacterium]
MRRWYPALLVLISVLVSVIAYPRLPARVPTHWDLHGQPNGYSSRLFATVFFPLLVLVMWGVLRALPNIDPRRANYDKMQSSYDLVVDAALTIIVLAHVSSIAAALGVHVAIERIIPAAIGVMMVVIGNVLPRARPNWWFGIRTPWTLSNDRVWERTHRVGGYLFTAAGVLIVAASFAPPLFALPAIIVFGAGSSLAATVYSYFVWREETRK